MLRLLVRRIARVQHRPAAVRGVATRTERLWNRSVRHDARRGDGTSFEQVLLQCRMGKSMPVSSIIDTHLHLWDPKVLRYPWLDQSPFLNRAFLLDDFHAATKEVTIEAMVFVQCEAEQSAFEREAAWVTEQAELEPRIGALVAWAPLENGLLVHADLARLRHNCLLRGIRRIIQFESDLEFCLNPRFIAGVRLLREFDLSFDICVDQRHLGNICKFVERVGELPMILDHLGKPDIRSRALQSWAAQLRTLAGFPSVVCKISGVATEADHQSWKPDDLIPYIVAAIDAFGFDRILFGGDWPVCTQAIEYMRWVELLDSVLSGVDVHEQRKFWRENAVRVYRLENVAALPAH
jgi:L-fuconolactonase